MRVRYAAGWILIGCLVASGCGDGEESGGGGARDGQAGDAPGTGAKPSGGSGGTGASGGAAATGGVGGSAATGGATAGSGGSAATGGTGGAAAAAGAGGVAGTDASAGTGGGAGAGGASGGVGGTGATGGTGGSGTGATGGTGGSPIDASPDSAGSGGVGGTGGGGGTGGVDASLGGSGGAADAGDAASACVPVKCLGQIYACGDCVDNDSDGKIDVGSDPDCLGPCHNAEDTLYGSIPGQAGPACTVDCYFDSNSGTGNDDCYWNHKCDPLSVAPKYPPEGDPTCAYNPQANTPGTNASCAQLMITQSQACADFCRPLTPNGCDCFGCCELPAHSGKYVWLGSEDSSGNGTCDLASLADPDKCRPCTPVNSCINTCLKCELCIGKTVLPAECLPDAGCPTPTCDPGIQPCGPSCLPKCPSGYFCNTGCCIREP